MKSGLWIILINHYFLKGFWNSYVSQNDLSNSTNKKIRIVKFGSRILKNPECQTQILKNPDCQLQVLKNSNMYWKFLIVKFRVSKIRIVKFGMWIIWRIKFGFQKVCIVKNQVRLCGPGVVEINKRGDHFIAVRIF